MFDTKKIFEKIKPENFFVYNPIHKIREKESELHVKFANIIITSSDPEELKNKIVKETAIALKAFRCFIVEIDQKTNRFKKITNSYNQKRDSESLLGIDVETMAPNIAIKQKYLKSTVIEDANKFIIENDLVGSKEESYYIKYKVKSSLSVRLEFGEVFLGIIVVHYDYKKSNLYDFDLKFLQNIAEHVSVALYLSQLYVKEKAERERERLLTSIISIMNRDFDLDNIIKKIFEILATMYDADSAFINVDMENLQNYYFYNSPQYMGNYSQQTMNKDSVEIYNMSIFDSVRNITNYIADTHNFIIQNNLENSSIEYYFQKHDIKSLILLTVYHETLVVGLLAIHFSKPNQINSEDLAFIKTINEQLAIAIRQSSDFKKECDSAKREALIRNIAQKIRSSLEIEETLNFICEETAKLFDVQRVTIVKFDDRENQENYEIVREYKISADLKGLESAEYSKKAAAYWNEKLATETEILAFDNLLESETPDYFRECYNSLGVKSMIGSAIKKGTIQWGTLVLSEYQRLRHWTSEEKVLLKTIANQVYIAINQAELYTELKQTMIKLNTILENIPFWVWIKDKEGRYVLANREYAKDINILEEDFVGKTDFDFFPKEIAEIYVKNDKKVMEFTKDTTFLDEDTIVNDEKRYLETYKQPYLNVKGEIIGTIGIAKDITEKKLAEQELLLRQEKIVKFAERERTLRIITAKIRGSLDIEEIKSEIVNQVGMFFNADRVALVFYDHPTKRYFVSKDSEYLQSESAKSFVGFDFMAVPGFEEHVCKLHVGGNDIIYNDLDAYLDENNLRGIDLENFFREFNCISLAAINIYDGKTFIGNIVITFEKQKDFLNEEINFLKIIADQTGVAFHQAELYFQTKQLAERERISRNIIEILRSSMDKTIIKKLFVKNIGKFFDADRVYFSEFDSAAKRYLPVDKNSEYLSGIDVKSLVDYDWSDPGLMEHIKPLLEKREIRILAIDEYLSEHPNTSKELLSLYENLNVKSSYSFPVLYQENIIGYFCLEFTNKIFKLSEEDIGRIRSICTQAGIALYHAELYLKAQQCMMQKGYFSAKMAEQIVQPTSEILEKAETLSKQELERAVQLEYLDNIIGSCNQLLELTKNIPKELI